MPRFVLALLVALGIGVFAAPALAHVHGGGHAGHGAAAVATPPSTPRVAKPAVAEIGVAVVAAVARLADDGCDRDCGHTPGMGGCLCMAACAAVTLPDLPHLLPHPVLAAPVSRDSPIWRPTTRGPPTPPPRA